MRRVIDNLSYWSTRLNEMMSTSQREMIRGCYRCDRLMKQDLPIEGVVFIWLDGGASRLGNDAPVELVVLLHESPKFTSVICL